MKTARALTCLYFVVAILAVLFYLSGAAMAEPPKKDKKQDANERVPEHDSFDNNGSDTFENSPTPTFTPEPLRPEKKVGKEKKEKKGDDGVVQLANGGTINLKVIGMTVTPFGSGSSAGDSGLPGAAATLTVVVRNLGNVTAENFPLDVWFSRPSAPAFGSSGDMTTTISSLSGGASITLTFTFTFGATYGASLAWSIVNTSNVIAETTTVDNRAFVQYAVIEMATVVPPTVTTVAGASVVFRGVAKPYGKKWPVEQPSVLITIPNVGAFTIDNQATTGGQTITFVPNVGTFGPINTNLIGDASLTCQLLANFEDTATITFVCGTSTASGELRIAKVDLIAEPFTDGTHTVNISPKICTNAQTFYRKAKWKVRVLPEGSTAKITSIGSATVTFEGVGGSNPNALRNGEFVLVTTDGSLGDYKIKLTHNLVPSQFVEKTEKVFRFVFLQELEDTESGAAGTGSVSPDLLGVNGTTLLGDDTGTNAATVVYKKNVFIETEPVAQIFSGTVRSAFKVGFVTTALEITVARNDTALLGDDAGNINFSFGLIQFGFANLGAVGRVEGGISIDGTAYFTDSKEVTSTQLFPFIPTSKTETQNLQATKSGSIRDFTVGAVPTKVPLDIQLTGASASRDSNLHVPACLGAVRFTPAQGTTVLLDDDNIFEIKP